MRLRKSRSQFSKTAVSFSMVGDVVTL